MTDLRSLRESAEALRRQNQWRAASDKFSDLLQQTYHPDADLSVQTCVDLIHYAECLVEGFSVAEAEDDDDLETAWDSLEHARLSYEKMDAAQRPPTGLSDVHELLAEISVKNHNYDEAIGQYAAVAQIAAENPNLSWRIGLNALYMRAVVLATAGRVPDAREAFARAVEFIDQKKPGADEADRADLDAFRASIVQRAAGLDQ
jgi:tetratricopeptide (TPR) repeat protein